MRRRAPHVLMAALAVWLGGCRLFTDFGEFEVVDDAGVEYTFDVFVAELASRMCDRARRCEGKVGSAADDQMACAHVPGGASTSVFELTIASSIFGGVAGAATARWRVCGRVLLPLQGQTVARILIADLSMAGVQGVLIAQEQLEQYRRIAADRSSSASSPRPRRTARSCT